ncbi:MAG: hypothetical protein Q9165_000889 [Trypethelium subeluteriae]
MEPLPFRPSGPRGGKKPGANPAQPLTQIPSSYEGWVLHKAESLPGERKTWSRIEKNPMPYSEAELAGKLKSKDWRRPDAYRNLPLQSQRNQINRLIASRNKGEVDPNLLWSLAGIDTRIERNYRTRRLETAEIYVILKRNAKLSAAARNAFGLGDNRGLSGEIVDLRDPIEKPNKKKGPGKRNSAHENLDPPAPPVHGAPAHEEPVHAIPDQSDPHRQSEGIDIISPVPPAPPVPARSPFEEPGSRLSMRTGSPHMFKRGRGSPKLVPRDDEHFLVDGEVEDDHDDDLVHIVEDSRTRKKPVRKIRARVSRIPGGPVATHALPRPIHHHQNPRRPPTPPHTRRRLTNWSDDADDDDDSIFSPSGPSIATSANIGMVLSDTEFLTICEAIATSIKCLSQTSGPHITVTFEDQSYQQQPVLGPTIDDQSEGPSKNRV